MGQVGQGQRGAAVWRWLDRHINRETGVGVAPGGSVLPAPTRGAVDHLLRTLAQPHRQVSVETSAVLLTDLLTNSSARGRTSRPMTPAYRDQGA